MKNIRSAANAPKVHAFTADCGEGIDDRDVWPGDTVILDYADGSYLGARVSTENMCPLADLE